MFKNITVTVLDKILSFFRIEVVATTKILPIGVLKFDTTRR